MTGLGEDHSFESPSTQPCTGKYILQTLWYLIDYFEYSLRTHIMIILTLEYLGNNVVTKKANNDVIVKLPETKRNFFCILGLVKDVKKFCKDVELFCSRGYRLNTMA